MRWQEKKPGGYRYKRRFLLWPVKLDGQYRWLEMASIRQCYYRIPTFSNFTRGAWRNECWSDE